MKIDDDLNIILDSDGVKIYSVPLSEAVFDANFKVLSAAQKELFSDGIEVSVMTGPRTAALTLKDEGARLAAKVGATGDMGASALMSEIKRLTTILAPSAAGWDFVPVDAAIAQGHIDHADWKEIESTLAFFMCAAFLIPRRGRNVLMAALVAQMNGSTTSLNCEDYTRLLPTSSAEPAGKAGSSVPI